MVGVWGEAKRRKAVRVTAIACLAFALGLAVVGVLQAPRGVAPPSVAVLPFENLSPDSEDAFLAAGLHAHTLGQLMSVQDLGVIARTSVMRYQRGDLPIAAIAEALGVETLLQGSVRRTGDRVRIAARLIHAATEAQLWSGVYERDFADLFAIQADIITQIAAALDVPLPTGARQRIEQAPTRSAHAYALYLRSLARVASGDEAAIYSLGWSDDLDRAVALDPAFALAHARKAWNFAAVLKSNVPAQRAAFQHFAEEHAQRALQMDPELGVAHAALAVVHRANWRWGEAQTAFQRALALRPNDAAVLLAYSRTQRDRGAYGEAIRSALRATQIDPGSGRGQLQLGIGYRYARDHEAAVRAFRRALNLTPGAAGAHAQLGFAEASRGNPTEALQALQRAEQLYGASPPAMRLPQLAYGYAQIDRREDVMRLVDALQARARATPVGEALWALAYIAAGDYEQALQRLRIAVAEQAPELATLAEIKANPYADPLLEAPGFRELRGRIGR